MGTRTYVRYFDPEEVEEMQTILSRVEAHLVDRSSHISSDALAAGRARIAVVKNGLALMAEPVAEMLGG